MEGACNMGQTRPVIQIANHLKGLTEGKQVERIQMKPVPVQNIQYPRRKSFLH